MISMITIFWIFVGFFAIIGALRGWSQEIVAGAGQVLSLFAIKQFGFYLIRVFQMIPDQASPTDINAIYRNQFWTLALIHLMITFWSYQGPVTSRVSNRIGTRSGTQDKLLGAVLRGLNGYLLVGTIYSFLEFRIVNNQFERLAANVPYPFSADVVSRPFDALTSTIFNNLPFAIFQNPLFLPLLLVIMFLIILIVVI